MPAKAGRKAKPLSQNLDELEQKLIDLANAQREEDDVRGEEKESLLTKEGKAERKKKIKEITNKKSVLSRAINDIRGRLKRQTKEQKSQAIMKQVNDRLDQINQNPKVDIQITKTRLQRLKGFLGIGQQTEQKEQDPAQTPPSGRRSPGRMSPSGTPEAPGSQASSIVPSGMATPEEEEEPIQYASVGDISREQKAQFDKEDTVKRLVDGALIGAVIELQSENKLTDNVNKAEEKGSNTQIITPEYLLRDRPRSEIVEMKRGIPPPNQRPQINELLNSEVEPVPDVININQNQIGINERIKDNKI
jgi:small-conductance mechanosensitive channel